MFLLDAINLGLHVRVPALDQDGEFTRQPTRAKPVEYDFLRRALDQGIRQSPRRFFEPHGSAAPSTEGEGWACRHEHPDKDD